MSKNKPKTGPTRAQQKLVAQYLLDDALDALGDHYDSTFSSRWGAACIEVAAVLGVRQRCGRLASSSRRSARRHGMAS